MALKCRKLPPLLCYLQLLFLGLFSHPTKAIDFGGLGLGILVGDVNRRYAAKSAASRSALLPADADEFSASRGKRMA
jgi:hypothetical protein